MSKVMEAGVRRMASGTLAWVDDKGRAEVMRCSWLVEVPNGNPEPDSRDDMYDVVECGGRVKGDPNGVTECEHGHRRAPYGSAEAEWDLMMVDRYDR